MNKNNPSPWSAKKLFLSSAILTLTFLAASAAAETKPLSATSTPNRAQVAQNYARLPLAFERNLGQADPAVQFFSRGHGYLLMLERQRASLVLKSSKDAPPAVFGLALLNANVNAGIAGEQQLPGRANYLVGD